MHFGMKRFCQYLGERFTQVGLRCSWLPPLWQSPAEKALFVLSK